MISRGRLIAVNIPIAFIAAISWFGIFTFVNGFMITGLGATDGQWATATLWLIGGMMVWQLALSDIASTLGRRLTITLALASVAVGYGLLTVVRTPMLVGPTLGLMAVAQSAILVVWIPMMADLGRDRPGRMMAMSVLINMLASVGALIGGGYVIAWMDYAVAFRVFGAISLVCAIAFHLLSHKLEPPGSERVVALRHLRAADVRSLASPPFLIVLLVGIGLEPFNFHTLNQLFPNLAREAHGLSEHTISQIVGWGRVPALFTLLLMAQRIDRVTPVRWYGIALTLSALTVIGLGAAPAATPLVLLYLGFYFFHGVTWASNNAAVNVTVPPRLRTVAFTLLSLVSNGAILLVGLTHRAMLAGHVALERIFMACGCVALAAGIVLIFHSTTRAGSKRGATVEVTMTQDL